MKNNKIVFIVVLAVAIVLFALASGGYAATPLPTPSPILASTPDPQEAAIEQAIQQAVSAHQNEALFYQIYIIKVENIRIDPASKKAVAWMTPVERASGKVVPTEPGLAVLQQASNGEWQAVLPTDITYTDQLRALPADLVNEDLVNSLLAPQTIQPQLTQALTGYFLPWEGKQGKYLSGSIGHFLIYHSCLETSCRYAYDFYDGTMFPLLASKGGTVWSAYDSCINNDHSCTNYLVLRDSSTSPVTYQLYYHLANSSIPAALKVIGAPVSQGDPIGNVDNTGYSSGSHIHFMVYADPTTPGSHWGNSVDIIFADVTVNGGRPRTCYEAKTFPSYGTECMPYDYYVSGNKYNAPPSGSLSLPVARADITTQNLQVSGQASDENGVANLQLVANTDGFWRPITNPFNTNPFSVSVDLCANNIPDGPFSIGLLAWDTKGTRNQDPIGARPVVKRYACAVQPPPCIPTADEVALYSLPDYQGTCQMFSRTGGIKNNGAYNTIDLTGIGDNTAASVQVGANVAVTLNDLDIGLNGRSQYFESSDPALADDRIGTATVSSLIVQPRIFPGLPVPNNPPVIRTDRGLTSTDSLTLTWPETSLASEYQVDLIKPGNVRVTSPWLKANAWPVGSLPAGNYSWVLKARNNAGTASSTAVSFSVAAASLPGATSLSLPITEYFTSTNGWISSGLWRLDSAGYWVSNAPGATLYDSSTIFTGDLTSPPISIPTGSPNYLRFHSFYQAESPAPYWDQRWVQVSVDGGPFTNFYQMADDMGWDSVHAESSFWMYSPYLNLSAFAGKTIRLRFHFDTTDHNYNSFIGWRVDDLTINTTGPDTSCADAAPNDSPAQATPVSINTSLSGVICPVGDVDFYQFAASAGQTITFDIDAQSQTPPSSLDSVISLFDSDGQSVLAENDDEIPWSVRDSFLKYTFHHNGTFYLRVKAWSYPGTGGPGYFYNLKISEDAMLPAVARTYPTGNWIPPHVFTLTADASDADNGMARVDFYWHSDNWAQDNWVLIGSDSNGADGWSAAFDPTGKVIPGSALLLKAVDRGGLDTSLVYWDLVTDNVSPVTRLTALPATTNSTVIPLSWTASDAIGQIDHFDIQYMIDSSGSWLPWTTNLPGTLRAALFPAQAGHTYGFTIRGTDKAGNVESYASTPETSTATAASCSADAFEAVGGDNSAPSAIPLPLGTTQLHNICGANDQDWVAFTVPAAGRYLVRAAIPTGSGAAVNVQVTSESGTLLGESQSFALGKWVDLRVDLPAAGTYLVHIRALSTDMFGTDYKYTIWAGPGYWQFLGLAK